jgi:hypothetical protein
VPPHRCRSNRCTHCHFDLSPNHLFARGFAWEGFQPLLHGRLLELLGASTHLAICSKSPCSIAISIWPYLQDAISSSPPLQLSRKVVRTRSEHNSQSARALHYVRTHPGTIAERNLISKLGIAKLGILCGDSRPHWVQTEKAEIPSCANSQCGTLISFGVEATHKSWVHY